MIPALPEKDGQAPARPAASAPTPSPHPLTEIFEQEVLDFITQRLREGDSEDEIADELAEHGATGDAIRPAIRQLAREKGIDLLTRPLPLTDLYDEAVINFVQERLGQSESSIVAELRKHDFSSDEARWLIRRVHKWRDRKNVLAQYEKGKIHILVGGLVFVVGTIATIATFSLATNGAMRGGVLFWGAIIFGLLEMIMGISMVGNLSAKVKKATKYDRK